MSDLVSRRYPVPKILGINSTPKYVKAVLNVLKTVDRPLNISEIQRRAKIKTWNAAQNIVLQLEEKGMVVRVFESGTGHYFRLRKEGETEEGPIYVPEEESERHLREFFKGE